jgi:hypothetical protein
MSGATTLGAAAVENWAACTCSAVKALPAVVGILIATVRPARREKAVLLELRALLWRRERNMVVAVQGRRYGSVGGWETQWIDIWQVIRTQYTVLIGHAYQIWISPWVRFGSRGSLYGSMEQSVEMYCTVPQRALI